MSVRLHYYNCIFNEQGINSTFGKHTCTPTGNHTCTPTALSKDETLQNHASDLNTFNIQVNGTEEYELPYLYWISKLHKNPYKQRYIAGSSKCSTKHLSLLITKILTTFKVQLQTYCETTYARCGVNQMWILKTSKEFLVNLKS